mmetsp:Transcript_38399/g.92905  ORF Transcript_38399/g.92905 Transcript_38399/m.92905 type:complete len:142 (-) Transcript_38399:56-481(-)
MTWFTLEQINYSRYRDLRILGLLAAVVGVEAVAVAEEEAVVGVEVALEVVVVAVVASEAVVALEVVAVVEVVSDAGAVVVAEAEAATRDNRFLNCNQYISMHTFGASGLIGTKILLRNKPQPLRFIFNSIIYLLYGVLIYF